MGRHYDVITSISKTYTLRRLRTAIFADIIKIVTMLIKTIFKDTEKVKRIKNDPLKGNLHLYFLIYQIC